MTVKELAKITGGILQGKGTGIVGDIVLDLNLVKPGDIFAGYQKDHLGGRLYINAAFAKGAACCLTEEAKPFATGDIVVVENLHLAIQQIGKAVRNSYDIPVIGITGSTGKTTAKEMTAAVLSQRMKVHRTFENLNNHFGVPMTLAGIKKEHEAVVVEMGISEFGEMDFLSSMVKPTMALFTGIGFSHLENLHDLNGVYQAKTEMLKNMDGNAPLFINGDDPVLMQLSDRPNVITYGIGQDCDVKVDHIRTLPEGNISCSIRFDNKTIDLQIPAYGQHMAYAAAAGAAAGFYFGLKPEEIRKGILSYHGLKRRSNRIETGFLTLIDDTYNANPDSMRSAVDSLIFLKGRHVCILSDMLEQGEKAPEMHSQLGEYLKAKGIDLVLACGPMCRHLCKSAGNNAVFFETKARLIDALPEYIKEGDCILVKASRGMLMEDISDILKLYHKTEDTGTVNTKQSPRSKD